MSESFGRIDVSKDTMLFITNEIFEEKIKRSTTKENILKLIPKIYRKADSIDIIKMLSYETYNSLENLIKYVKNSNDIEGFVYDSKNKGAHYLEDAMIIVLRAKNMQYNYSINEGTLEELEKIFYEENKEIAKRYGKIESLITGILYSYGVIKKDELRSMICKYMNEIITEEELEELCFKRLNLNMFLNYFEINWNNLKKVESFVTYLDREEVDVVEIATEQKYRNFEYKKIDKKEILSRKEFLFDKSTQKIYKAIKSINGYLYDFEIESPFLQ